MDSLGCCWGCGNVRCIDVSNEKHWAPLIRWGWERAVKSYQASQDPLSAPCSTSERDSAAAQEGAAAPTLWRRSTRANTLLMPLWGQERQNIGVRFYRRSLCDAFRPVWCNNSELGEAKRLHKSRRMDLHVCLFLSSFCPPPRPPLTITMMPTWKLGLSVERLLPVKRRFFCASSIVRF